MAELKDAGRVDIGDIIEVFHGLTAVAELKEVASGRTVLGVRDFHGLTAVAELKVRFGFATA